MWKKEIKAHLTLLIDRSVRVPYTTGYNYTTDISLRMIGF